MSNPSRKVPLICSGHSRPVVEVNYSGISPDGFFLISACLDGKPMLRNGMTGDWIGTFVGHKGAVWSAYLNSGATLATTGSADYTAKVWDAITGEEKHSFTHTRIVKSSRFSSDSKKLLTGGQDKILRLFDLEKPEAEPLKLEGHTQPLRVALYSNESTVISAGQDSVLRIWDVRSLKEVKSIPAKAAISSVELSLDGKHVTTTAGKEVTFFNLSNWEVEKTYTLSTELNSASLAPDANTFVVGGSDFWVKVYDFKTGKELEVLKGHHGPVHCVQFAPDGATFCSGSEDGTVRLWQSGEPRSYGLWEENKEAAPKPDDH